MSITLNDLMVNFEHVDRASLLSEWRWLTGERCLPIVVTAMGNAVLQDLDSGTIGLLDVGTGKFEQVAESFDVFRSKLNDPEIVAELFLLNDFVATRESGLTLKPGQVYGYKRPPLLGGSFDASNIEATDMEVHFALLGQIARQIKDLPPGTPISNIVMG